VTPYNHPDCRSLLLGNVGGCSRLKEVLEDDIPSVSPYQYQGVGVSRNFSAKRERSLSPKDLVECKHQDVPGSGPSMPWRIMSRCW
jgi:hypothetical protein